MAGYSNWIASERHELPGRREYGGRHSLGHVVYGYNGNVNLSENVTGVLNQY